MTRGTPDRHGAASVATSATGSGASRIGRFELRRVLGRGAQATVWLAWDPVLQREVAVKRFLPDAGPAAAGTWLQEARMLGQLAHPGIVAVHEAWMENGHACVVLEHVPGGTLADRLHEPVPARAAVAWMRDVLDALACAHAQGVVHRDLKPSNVLLDGEGRPRVMDFGTAGRVHGHHDGAVVGTVAWMSPEAARGEPPQATMDVFAAGLMLGRMVLGQPLRAGLDRATHGDPAALLDRIQALPVRWPETSTPTVDDHLRAIILRATDLDVRARHPDATTFRQALAAWLEPAQSATEPARHGTLDFLLRRMRHAGEFPALSAAVQRIQRITSSDRESLNAVADEIMRDVALTQKVLRWVNSAPFGHVVRGEVTTVSRAAALIGLAGIRNMALSVLLLEHMSDRGRARQMREHFGQALLTAMLSEQLRHGSGPVGQAEEAFLAGMLSHLGRMLVSYYFPEEAARIRERMRADPLRPGRPAVAESRAAVEVLGLGLDDLGQGVARAWGLPDTLCRAMVLPMGEPPARWVAEPAERLRWRVRAAADLSRALMAGETEAQLAERARVLTAPLGLSPEQMAQAVVATRRHWSDLAPVLQLDPLPAGPAVVSAAATSSPRTDADLPTVAWGTPESNPAGAPGPRAEPVVSDSGVAALAADRQAALQTGLAQVATTLAADHFQLNQVLGQILGTLHLAGGFDHVIFCLRDARTGVMAGRLALGPNSEALRAQFLLDLRRPAANDLFVDCCLQGQDAWVAEGLPRPDARRLPGWYRNQAAPGFVLLPLMLKSAPLALIYADSAQPLHMPEPERALIRTLRNQAVLAFKASAG